MPFRILFFLWGLSLTASAQQDPTDKLYNCQVAYNLVDEFSGKQKMALAPQWFFSFTPEKFKKFFKEEDYLRVEGALLESEGQVALELSIILRDQEAQQQYGSITANGKLHIYTLNNKLIELVSYKGASANHQKDKSVYTCTFALTKKDIKTLQKAEIDRVRINWSKGFQNYEVFYLDFFADQLNCLEAVNN